MKIKYKNILKYKKIINKCIEYIFPPTCGICGKINKEYLCSKCKLVLDKQFKIMIEEIETDNGISKLIYGFKYDEVIRDNLINYKFNEKTNLYKTFVKFYIKNKKIFKILKSYDTIIPVPISKKRRKTRGYNQTELFSKYLASKLESQYRDDILIKVKDNKEQSTLTKEERITNIKGVYSLSKKYEKTLKTKKILLIDDIYTTGSTTKECILVLRKIYNKNIDIDVFVIARD